MCRAKLRKDAKVREVYKFGKTLGTGGTLCVLNECIDSQLFALQSLSM